MGRYATDRKFQENCDIYLTKTKENCNIDLETQKDANFKFGIPEDTG